jgi:hypothetical protein
MTRRWLIHTTESDSLVLDGVNRRYGRKGSEEDGRLHVARAVMVDEMERMERRRCRVAPY